MKSPVGRYAVAIAMPIAAILVQLAFRPVFEGVPFFFFFVTVFVSALICGFVPAIVTTFIFIGASMVYMQPRPAQSVAFAVTGVGIAWFVSSTRRSEEARKRAEIAHLVTIANVAPAIVWITDAGKSCTYVNDRWLEFSGRGREEELGFGWLDEMHPDDVRRCMPDFERAFSARKPVEIEYRQLRHDGVYRWVLSRGVPRFDSHGEFAGYIGVAFDIDDLRVADNERQRLTREIASQRERLLGIVSNVPGVVWEAWGQPDQASQRIDFVSDHVERMLGYTVEEWLATPNFWLNIVHPEDREAAAAHAHDHFAAGGPRTNTFRWLTKDGRAVWCEAHSTVIHDEHGVPLGMRGVTLDITSRKRAEDSVRFAARASEVLAASLDYEATLRATAQLAVPALADWCVIALIGEDGQARRVAVVHADPARNERAQQLLTMPFPENVPRQAAETAHRSQPFIVDMTAQDAGTTIVDDAHRKLVSELGGASLLVVPIEGRDRLMGSISLVSATPSRYGQNDVELASLLARRVAIAIDNAQLYRTALQASTAKDEFLATISHELRTPMTATLGWVRLLTLDQVEGDMKQTALQAIENATLAQARLIEDILDVSGIVLGKFRLEPGPVDLRAVVDAASLALSPAMSAKSIQLNVDSSRWSGVIHADSNRLQQVIWNLLANATKFGKREGRIDVVVERDDSLARIVVRDDGAGIDPVFLPFVFDRFRQAESGFVRNHGGLGLGLAIVRHMVELHGGTVSASSEGLGKGSSFVVELPAG